VEVAGTARHYVVTGVEKAAESEVPLDQVCRCDGAHELKVITCSGTFRRSTG
jgi:hypothetical protein